MGVEVVLATTVAVVSLYAALFHGWVFGLYRAARDHLWVAVCAAGAAAVCLGTASMWAGRTEADAFRAQWIQAFGAPAVTLGLLRFSSSHFGVAPRVLLRAADVWFAVVVALLLVAPEWLIDRSRPPRQAADLSIHFLQYGYTPLTRALLAPAFLFLVSSVGFCVRARRSGQRYATQLLVALGAWLLTAFHDTAVGLEVYDSIYLLSSGGYLVLVVSVSTILIRELVLTIGESERLGARLQELARARADELRAVELRLARGEQLAAVGTLAAGVAHEINNPLAYVSANLNHLRGLWEEKQACSAEVEEVLAECREGLARVAAIASDLLRMARQGASERAAVDLSEVVRSVLPLAEREAADEVRIETVLEPALGVHGSARLLGQVALNLMLNAIHASAGRVESEPRIEVETRPAEGDGAELVVRDNGPGIPEALRDRIFDSAFSTKPTGQGTGLGLALVRLIVTRHGGTIRAESGPEGAVVTVWLPTASGEAESDDG